MTRAFVEILILVLNALNADVLAIMAGVIQKMMNSMDEATFQNFTKHIHKTLQRSPYAVTAAVLPAIALIPYFIIFRFSNWWFTAGALVFVVASIVSKTLNLPTYLKIYNGLPGSDTAGLREWRQKLQARNRFRAVLQFVSVALMVIGLFGVS